jgi:hypothetical protein
MKVTVIGRGNVGRARESVARRRDFATLYDQIDAQRARPARPREL